MTADDLELAALSALIERRYSQRLTINPAQRGFYPLGRKRDLADASARSVEYRVADGCGRDGHRRFSGSCGLSIGTIDEHGFDLRNFRADRERTIRAPIDGGYLLIVPHDLFIQGAADAVQRASLELISQSIGIRNRPHIVRNHQPLHG